VIDGRFWTISLTGPEPAVYLYYRHHINLYSPSIVTATISGLPRNFGADRATPLLVVYSQPRRTIVRPYLSDGANVYTHSCAGFLGPAHPFTITNGIYTSVSPSLFRDSTQFAWPNSFVISESSGWPFQTFSKHESDARISRFSTIHVRWQRTDRSKKNDDGTRPIGCLSWHSTTRTRTPTSSRGSSRGCRTVGVRVCVMECQLYATRATSAKKLTEMSSTCWREVVESLRRRLFTPNDIIPSRSESLYTGHN